MAAAGLGHLWQRRTRRAATGDRTYNTRACFGGALGAVTRKAENHAAAVAPAGEGEHGVREANAEHAVVATTHVRAPNLKRQWVPSACQHGPVGVDGVLAPQRLPLGGAPAAHPRLSPVAWKLFLHRLQLRSLEA